MGETCLSADAAVAGGHLAGKRLCLDGKSDGPAVAVSVVGFQLPFFAVVE